MVSCPKAALVKARTTTHPRLNSILGPRQITPSPITKRYSPLFRRKTESTACGYQPNRFCVGSAHVSRVVPVRSKTRRGELGLCASRANDLPSGERRLPACWFRLLAETDFSASARLTINEALAREGYNET